MARIALNGRTERGRRPQLDFTDALRQFRSALNTVGTKPCDICFMGDSLTEGYFSSTDAGRWQNQVARKLQSIYNPGGVPGGETFIPAQHILLTPPAGATALPQRWTVGGGATALPYNAPVFGLGMGRVIQLSAVGQTASITITCDRFWIQYVSGSGAGNMTISIDGGTATTLDTYRAAGTLGGRFWDSGALTAGSHTVTIGVAAGSTGGTNVFIEGIKPFLGDGGAPGAGSGVRAWDGGHSGSATVDWNGNSSAGGWPDSLNNINPRLIVYMIGTNDYDNGQTIANYSSFLFNIVNKMKAQAPNASIVLMVPHTPGVAAGGDAGWQPFRERIYLCAQLLGCAVYDLYEELVPPVNATPGGDLYADAIHWNNAGQSIVANGLLRFLVSQDKAPLYTQQAAGSFTEDNRVTGDAYARWQQTVEGYIYTGPGTRAPWSAGRWNLDMPDASLPGLVVRGPSSGNQQLIEAFDWANNPIFAVSAAGGAAIFGDNFRIMPPGDVFNSVIKLRSDGTIQLAKGDAAGGTGVLALGNVTTTPTANPDGTHTMDGSVTAAGVVGWSTGGRWFWRGSDGTQYFAGNTESYLFSMPGPLLVANGSMIVPVPFNFAIESVTATLSVPSAGSAVNFDIKQSTTPNGTFASIFTTSPQIFAASYTISNAMAFPSSSFTGPLFLRLDITQVGSTTNGANLVVNLRVRRTS